MGILTCKIFYFVKSKTKADLSSPVNETDLALKCFFFQYSGRLHNKLY